MPTSSHYAGKSLPDTLREIANFHGKPSTRHITRYESQMIHRAAQLLEQLGIQ